MPNWRDPSDPSDDCPSLKPRMMLSLHTSTIDKQVVSPTDVNPFSTFTSFDILNLDPTRSGDRPHLVLRYCVIPFKSQWTRSVELRYTTFAEAEVEHRGRTHALQELRQHVKR
ncbi:hypothetical protein QCA50_008295 [Cerrena zonata]|uniref:Uncharacterized protein n=1 Tax=Cerrena zonata TaxID=2478898 RepID=A0AAW0GH14_9APHY